ncbi:hypothetical protein ABZ260_08620 [Streptosporangium sp. NPDC006013]|uniref:hypothetical protein n=1 Tax=Streptosporangium sp. NPDC006013 TaxID=3155596 RepID=UPI0033BB6696
MTLTDWRYLGARRDSEVLLGVNFDTGQTGANLAGLAANLPDLSLIELVFPPPQADFAAALTVTELVRRWDNEFAEHGLMARGVIGYCAGGGLARAIARAAAAESPMPVMIIDPSPVIPDTFYWSFHAATDSLTAQLPPGTVGRARQKAKSALAAAGRTTKPPTALATTLSQEYTGLVAAAGARLGLHDTLVRQLRTRFDAYLAYLLASAQAWSENENQQDGELVLLSKEHVYDEADFSRHQRFPLARADLLTDPTVAGVVLDAVAEAGRR